MSHLKIQSINCQYNQQIVLHNLDLQLAHNEILCLLGASGCGKTTLLKAIAGLQPISQGKILLQGQDLTSVPVEQRNIGFIFQDYALFPHLTVAQNIQFGLDKKSADEKQRILYDMLNLVHLSGLENRYPHQLSGGQQQRVAIARALACQPQLLLLDEPFSNIDSQIRYQMIDEIKQILKQQGISAIFVTHSKEEAFAFADKIALMKDGKIIQSGETDKLYYQPNCKFVAEFLGSCNYIDCYIDEKNRLHSLFGVQQLNDEINLANGKTAKKNTALQWLIRPHHIHIVPNLQGNGLILHKQFLGQYYQYQIQIVGSATLTEIKVQSNQFLSIGQKVQLSYQDTHPILWQTDL
ncbi:iron(III) transport system ATP-binding protein [Cricetibacter osteomyelitidis]|uniref:Iron(III) transport system ATP-binding protein n=1 Tax=Cricetibacter osteomyelitidis TaxID=1521931 RepID=A0A4R2SZP9_9PAST|nr:ABC transporter ATP-binding protein [Cricetibacter osteomyelitidis]TCP96049.1 iron(III) transport system ATP-binding protein [Cricetibacter osteomyelitidis]